MSEYTSRIPNLLGGLSQQPDSVRFPNQVGRCENAYPSIVDGMRRRSNTEHIAEMWNVPGGGGPFTYPKAHLINRDADEQYLVMVMDNDINVFDTQTGKKLQVDFPDPTKPYLQGTVALTPDDFELVTIADVTYVLNKTKTVTMRTSLTPERDPEVMFWVKQGAAAKGYTYKILANQNQGAGDQYTALVTTEDLTADTHGQRSDQIAAGLWNNDGNGGGTGIGIGGSYGLRNTLNRGFGATPNDTWPAGGFSGDLHGSTIWVSSTVHDPLTFEVTDSRSGTLLSYIHGIEGVAHFTDLPGEARNGFICKIRGVPEQDVDDYWVKAETLDGENMSNCKWVETVAPGIEYILNNDTMPHLLIRSGAVDVDGDPIFVFKRADGTTPATQATAGDDYSAFDWGDRTVGNEVSNPNPSFVGKTINSVFMWKNRLGLLAGENVILSESGEFFNFYRITVTELLDSGPIDVASTHNTVTTLKNAVAYSDRLLLFSDFAQFSLQGDPLLTPSTVSIVQTTEYAHFANVRPAPVGDAVMFAFKNGTGHSGIKEYRLADANIDSFLAEDITAHVAKFIEGDIFQIDVDTIESLLVVVTADGDCLVYKWYDVPGQGRKVSAWSKYTFGDDAKVRAAYFLDDELLLAIERPIPDTGGGVFYELFLEKVELRPSLPDDPNGAAFRTLMDRRITEADATSITYDIPTDTTSIVMPYRKSAGRDFVVCSRNDGAGGVEGVWYAPTFMAATGGFAVHVQGDITGLPLWLGEESNWLLELSEQFMRDSKDSVRTSGRYQLRGIRVGIGALGHLKATVTDVDARAFEYIVQDRDLNVNAIVGSTVSANGEYEFPVRVRSNEATVTLESVGPFPSGVLWLEILGSYDTHRKQL